MANGVLEKIAERINEKSSYEARVWRKGDKNRIYFKEQKWVSAYLDYDYEPSFFVGAAALENASLKVFSNCDSQGLKWNLNTAKQCKLNIMRALNKALNANFEICDNWQDVIL